MDEPKQGRSRAADGMDDMSAITTQSVDIMASAVSEWLRSANRGQADAIRFVKDCFNRDIEAISELAACKNPQDVFGLNAAVASSLVSEYLAEGARVFALYDGDGDNPPAPGDRHRARNTARIGDQGSDSRAPLWREALPGTHHQMCAPAH